MGLYRIVVIRGWWVVLLVVLGGTAYLGRHVPNLVVDAGTNVLINEDDPDLAYYYETRADWGYDEYAVVCVTRDDWMTAEGAALLAEIVAELEKVESVERVFSVLDIPLLRQNAFPMINPNNLTYLTSDGVDFEKARKELLAHTQARNNLISEDGTSLGILVYVSVPADSNEVDREWSKAMSEKFKDPEKAAPRLEELRTRKDAVNDQLKQRRTAMVNGCREVAETWSKKLGQPVRLSGVSTININLVEHVEYDLRVFGVAALSLLSFALLLMYRRPRFVFMPVLTCLMPVALIIGAMAWWQMKITVITSNLPVLLFVLMLPYTIYFVERYRERRALYPSESGRDSSLHAASEIWTPCLFSCATTMAGFSALMTSGILPVRTFGKMMTIGMGIGLTVVFLIAPAISAPLRAMTVGSPGSSGHQRSRGMLRVLEWLSLKVPALMVLVSLAMLGASVWGASKLEAEAKFTEYFWPDSELYQGLEYVDQRLGGTTSIEIILKSDQKDFFITPKGLEALEAAASYFDDIPEAGSVRSVKTLVDELGKKNKMFTQPMFLKMLVGVPKVKSLTSEYANDDFTVTRIFVRMKETAPTLHRNDILRGLRKHLAENEKLEGLEVRETGVFMQYANVLNSLIKSQRETFLLVIGAIFVMLIILFRNPILAFLVLLPQVMPAVVMLGVMGFAGIPLDLVTVMIGSVAMGVGIDAAIQYTIRFRAELAVDGDRRAALMRSHATTGRAIWIATTVIIIGFCILMLSKFKPSVWFGLFTAIAMLISQLAALTTLPSIFLLTGFPRIPKNFRPADASQIVEESPPHAEPTDAPSSPS